MLSFSLVFYLQNWFCLTLYEIFKCRFSYDPITKKVQDLGISEDSTPSQVKEHRNAVDKAIQSYIAIYYPEGVACVYGRSDDSGSPMVIVCIEDHKYSPSNFWNGKWRSEWKVLLNY